MGPIFRVVGAHDTKVSSSSEDIRVLHCFENTSENIHLVCERMLFKPNDSAVVCGG